MMNSTLTMRDRFFAQMQPNPAVAVPNWEFGYWDATLTNWHEQGMPKEVNDRPKAYAYFGIEGLHFADGFFLPGCKLRLWPAFEPRNFGVDEAGHELMSDQDGVVFKQIAEGAKTIPHYVDYPIKTRSDWYERYKPRLDPRSAERVPEVDWERHVDDILATGKPVCLYMDSFMGYLRNLMGFEAFAMLPFDDPDLFEDMVETLTQIKEAAIDRLSGRIRVDIVQYWEDICYNAGPIIHPSAFRDVVVPRQTRINERLRQELGVKYIVVDCDGDFATLLPGWIESGVNVLMPCEVDAGMDIIALQQQYGERCGFFGGIQKKALIEGPQAIRRELERVLPAVRNGGYIPHLDHSCPANVSMENYRLYLQLKHEILGCFAPQN